MPKKSRIKVGDLGVVKFCGKDNLALVIEDRGLIAVGGVRVLRILWRGGVEAEIGSELFLRISEAEARSRFPGDSRYWRIDVNGSIRAALESAGFRIGDFDDFLGLSGEERSRVLRIVEDAEDIHASKQALA